MKVARVIPLFKSGILSLLTNYRPVSVLPTFSMFLERILYKCLDSFLFKYRILSCNQYCFRKNHSTAYALIQLYDKLSNAINQGKVTLGLFTVQVRDKRPTHTQNACTIFAQTRVKKRVP